MAISLEKGKKVNLRKQEKVGLGEILVNLNWNSKPAKKGFLGSLFGGGSKPIDLDLGCLYELKNGRKGTVQALGNAFGSLQQEPYIALDGDDRTGAVATGENLRIDGNHIADIKRVLVYTYIYEGVANWQQADAVVTIRYPGAEDLVVKMDDYQSNQIMCGLVLLENVNDETRQPQTKGFLASLFGGGEPQAIDCDASALLLQDGKLRNWKDVVYFGALRHGSGAVQHMGDNLTGAGEGDDEQIVIELDKVPAQYDRIVVVVNIFRAEARHQHFGMIENAFIRIVDARNNQELCRFNLSEHYDGMTAMIFGEVYRHGNEWKFNAIGQATTDPSLQALSKRYQ